jgi:hypothetical protein
MASGGHCGHGVRVKTPWRLVPCQASSASESTARKCQLMTKTSAMPGADRKDGSSNATPLLQLFLGVDMKKIIAYCGLNSKTGSTYLLLKDHFHKLSRDDQMNALIELIEEFQHELNYIKEYTQDTSTSHQ